MKKTLLALTITTLFCIVFLVSCGTNHTHEFGSWTVVKNPTCTEDGMQERLCSCGEKQTQAIPAAHSFDTGKVIKNPTCTEEGTKQFTCSVCGTTKDEAVSKIDHTYDSGKITAEASCSHSGTKTFTCTLCGQTKTETIAALGHNPNSNYICQRCGEKCPVPLDMTSTEKSNASNVHWISNRTIYHRDEKSQFELHFQFKDASETPIAAPCVVEVRIVNDNNETVYSAIKVVNSSDFSTWTYGNGTERFQATIYIKDSEITPGKSSKGTVYFTVYNEGYFSFDESDVSISDDLPVESVSVSLPNLPQTISYYGYSGTKYSSCKVTNITYEVSDDDLYLYFTVEKTYDKEGSGHSDSCKVGWKLYDSEGYVVDSGTFYSDSIKVGEKVKGSIEYVWNCIEPGGSYRLEILDVE